MVDIEKVIKGIQECDLNGGLIGNCPYKDILSLLKESEAVVRCKDCKYRSKELYDYYGNKNDKRYVCQINDIAKNPDWFCADGEKRE